MLTGNTALSREPQKIMRVDFGGSPPLRYAVDREGRIRIDAYDEISSDGATPWIVIYSDGECLLRARADRAIIYYSPAMPGWINGLGMAGMV